MGTGHWSCSPPSWISWCDLDFAELQYASKWATKWAQDYMSIRTGGANIGRRTPSAVLAFVVQCMCFIHSSTTSNLKWHTANVSHIILTLCKSITKLLAGLFTWNSLIVYLLDSEISVSIFGAVNKQQSMKYETPFNKLTFLALAQKHYASLSITYFLWRWIAFI